MTETAGCMNNVWLLRGSSGTVFVSDRPDPGCCSCDEKSQDDHTEAGRDIPQDRYQAECKAAQHGEDDEDSDKVIFL